MKEGKRKRIEVNITAVLVIVANFVNCQIVHTHSTSLMGPELVKCRDHYAGKSLFSFSFIQVSASANFKVQLT